MILIDSNDVMDLQLVEKMTLPNYTLLPYRVLTSFASISKFISLYPTIYIYVYCPKSPLNWS